MQSYSNLAPPLISQSPANSEATILDSYVANKKFYLFLKRIADISGSLFFIIAVLSWLTPLVALAIIFESKGPVFFRQRRIGKNGKYFFCLKFRTMIENDEADERQG
ncbi:MAG: polyprenyl glycosylphosphotransferase, partial [Chitinophagaceae bacterium]